MCTTCGCSDDAKPKLIDVNTGVTRMIDDAQSQKNSGSHPKLSDYGYHHDHGHSHDEHGHSHDHMHGPNGGSSHAPPRGTTLARG